MPLTQIIKYKVKTAHPRRPQAAAPQPERRRRARQKEAAGRSAQPARCSVQRAGPWVGLAAALPAPEKLRIILQPASFALAARPGERRPGLAPGADPRATVGGRGTAQASGRSGSGRERLHERLARSIDDTVNKEN